MAQVRAVSVIHPIRMRSWCVLFSLDIDLSIHFILYLKHLLSHSFHFLTLKLVEYLCTPPKKGMVSVGETYSLTDKRIAVLSNTIPCNRSFRHFTCDMYEKVVFMKIGEDLYCRVHQSPNVTASRTHAKFEKILRPWKRTKREVRGNSSLASRGHSSQASRRKSQSELRRNSSR